MHVQHESCDGCGEPFRRDARARFCLECSQDRARSAVRNYQSKYPLASRAHRIVQDAVKRGLILPPSEKNCVDCGEQAVNYDHRDYSLPLEIEPVCQSCNFRRGPGANRGEEKQGSSPRRVTYQRNNPALREAVDKVGLRKLAFACGVSYQAIRKWEIKGSLPRTEWTGETRYAEIIERETGGSVKARQVLNSPIGPDDTAIEKAVEICGGQAELARLIGYTQQSISTWIKGARTAPEACKAIEQATGGTVTAIDLRPDVFGPPQPGDDAAA